MKYTKAQIEKLLQRIFDGEVTDEELPEDLYYAIAEYLKKALYKGFGQSLEEARLEGRRDYELLQELRENVYMFSAAKTYQEVRTMSDYLVTDEGKMATFAEFKQGALETLETYNGDYLRTEYNTAIGQAQNAVKWDDIEKNKKILPNLRYEAIGDACDICEPLDGLVAPVDDPIWSEIMPLNHFNCLCTVTQEDADAELTSEETKKALYDNASDKMADLFKMNPGKDKIIFSDEHPYYDVAAKDKESAENNFGLPIPETDDDE